MYPRMQTRRWLREDVRSFEMSPGSVHIACATSRAGGSELCRDVRAKGGRAVHGSRLATLAGRRLNEPVTKGRLGRWRPFRKQAQISR